MQKERQKIIKVLEACKKGDRNAQQYVYKQYFHAMYNTAFRIVKDQFEAEDLMQESFVSAFSKLDSFNGKSSFGAWLKRIVINNSISHLRKQKNHIVEFNEKIDVIEEEKVDESKTIYKVDNVIKQIYKMKDNYRIPLSLILIEGYDYEEVSQILGITNQNCRTIVSRAKSKLRAMLLHHV